jgi:diacylglycerol kinase family enzyme
MSNRIVLEADDRRLDVANSALVVSNSKYTGGKMKIAPAADTSDGQADIVLLTASTAADPGHLLRRLRCTPPTQVDLIQAARSPSVRSLLRLMADGGLIGWTPPASRACGRTRHLA